MSNLFLQTRRFGLSPSSVGGFNHAIQKIVRVRTESAQMKYTVNKTENHCYFSSRKCNARLTHSHKKLKLMSSPFGQSVPSLKINFISCCLRLMLLPEHCFKPQTMMSSREWEAELKCSRKPARLVSNATEVFAETFP